MKKNSSINEWMYDVGDIIFLPHRQTKTKAGGTIDLYLVLKHDDTSFDGTKFYQVMDLTSGSGEVRYIEQYQANVDWRGVENDGYDL